MIDWYPLVHKRHASICLLFTTKLAKRQAHELPDQYWTAPAAHHCGQQIVINRHQMANAGGKWTRAAPDDLELGFELCVIKTTT